VGPSRWSSAALLPTIEAYGCDSSSAGGGLHFAGYSSATLKAEAAAGLTRVSYGSGSSELSKG